MLISLHRLPACLLAGGLTGCSRLVCGEDADLSSYISLLRRQMESGSDNGGPDIELCQRVEESGLSLEEYISHCNPHLVPPGCSLPATKTIYADINSLYAAAGDMLLLMLLLLPLSPPPLSAALPPPLPAAASCLPAFAVFVSSPTHGP